MDTRRAIVSPLSSLRATLRTTGMNAALLLRAPGSQLMVILDITAVNIALPAWPRTCSSAAHRSAGRSPATRSSSGASCSSAAARPTCSGAAAVPDGLAVLTLSSLASALAGTASALFAGTRGQGLGAAMLSRRSVDHHDLLPRTREGEGTWPPGVSRRRAVQRSAFCRWPSDRVRGLAAARRLIERDFSEEACFAAYELALRDVAAAGRRRGRASR